MPFLLCCTIFNIFLEKEPFSLNTKSSLTIDILFNQVQVGGKKNSVILQKLSPDTPYSITVAAVYRSGESKDISGQGKTSKWLQENPCNVLKYFMTPFVKRKQ